jgi:hypothetical protein
MIIDSLRLRSWTRYFNIIQQNRTKPLTILRLKLNHIVYKFHFKTEYVWCTNRQSNTELRSHLYGHLIPSRIIHSFYVNEHEKNLFAQGAKTSEYSIPLYAKLRDLRNTITRLFLLHIRVCGLFRM